MSFYPIKWAWCCRLLSSDIALSGLPYDAALGSTLCHIPSWRSGHNIFTWIMLDSAFLDINFPETLCNPWTHFIHRLFPFCYSYGPNEHQEPSLSRPSIHSEPLALKDLQPVYSNGETFLRNRGIQGWAVKKEGLSSNSGSFDTQF